MSTVVGRVIVQSKPFAAVNCRKMSTVVGFQQILCLGNLGVYSKKMTTIVGKIEGKTEDY